MGNSCVKHEREIDHVYKQLFDRCYEEVQRGCDNPNIESLKTNKFVYVKASVERKGVVRKLLEHLESHKQKLAPCITYMTGFGTNTLLTFDMLHLKYANLIVLQALLQARGALTQDHNFIKPNKSPKVLRIPFRRESLSRKRIEQERKKVMLQSDSLSKAYELSVTKLIFFFGGMQLSEDERHSFLSCIALYCKQDPLKFDKQTTETLLKLVGDFFVSDAITDSEVLLCLSTFENLLRNLSEEVDVAIIATAFKQVLLYKFRAILNEHSQTSECLSRIISLYESLLHESKYLGIYEVLFEVWNSDLQWKEALFVLSFNNIVLLVLVRILTTEALKGRLLGVDDIGPAYLNIQQFTHLRDVENRNLVFRTLIEYIRWGYRTNKDKMLLPLHQICICLMSKGLLLGINVVDWISTVIELMKECEVKLQLLFKELLFTYEEFRGCDAEEQAINGLQLLKYLLTREGDCLQEALDEDIYSTLSCQAYRISPRLKLSLGILEVVSSLLGMRRFFDLSDAHHYVVTVIAHDICRLINSQYTPAYTETMYACGLRICDILLSLRSHNLNLFLALLTKLIEVYLDPLKNTWFKCGYFAMIRASTSDCQLIVTQSVPSNNELLAAIKFVFSIDSPDTCSKMIDKMKRFQKQTVSLDDEQIRGLPEFNQGLYRRFCEVLGLTNINSDIVTTTQSDMNAPIILIPNATAAKQYSVPISNDESLQEVLDYLHTV